MFQTMECTSTCLGYLSAFISTLAFGSFCVPMKGEAARVVDVDPLVFQTYKTSVCLLSSFTVLFMGVDRLTFTPWGIISGLFWVPAGVAHICGVRTAGLAITQGTASSLIVLVSFSWGIFIFHERVRSLTSACCAVLLMCCGICGMSYFSAPPSSSSSSSSKQSKGGGKRHLICMPNNNKAGSSTVVSSPPSTGGVLLPGSVGGGGAAGVTSDGTVVGKKRQSILHRIGSFLRKDSLDVEMVSFNEGDEHLMLDDEVEDMAVVPHGGGGGGGGAICKKKVVPTCDNPIEQRDGKGVDEESPPSHQQQPQQRPTPPPPPPPPTSPKRSHRFGGKNKQQAHPHDKPNGKKGGAHALVLGLSYHLKKRHGLELTVRQMGLVITAVGAAWGGSVMVPLHYAGDDAKGINFVFSFALGATLINTLLWLLRYHHQYVNSNYNHLSAYRSLPSFHIRRMAFPGFTSGLLWSIGNMSSMVSVTHLGQGVGYSVTQSSMLISGLWGIFWFHEITNGYAIRGWMVSACLTISGILLLSYNHLPPAPVPVLKG